MIGERTSHIADINQKYVGSRPGTIRSYSYISPQPGVSAGLAGTTVTRIGPVSTLGTLPIVPTPVVNVAGGSVTGSPVSKRPIEVIDAHTPAFDSGAVHTQQPAEFWDNDVDGQNRASGAVGLTTRKPSCFERCNAKCPRICGCPWWVALLLGVLTIAAVVAGLMASGLRTTDNAFGDASSKSNQVIVNTSASSATAGTITSSNVTDSKETTTDRKEILNCSAGYILHNGKCLSCPGESKWNGTHCIKTQLVNTTTTTITNSSGTFVIPNDNAAHPVATTSHNENAQDLD